MKPFLSIFLIIFFNSVTPLSAAWIVNEPSITLLDEPQEGSEIEDIVAYGLPVELEEAKEGWVKIHNLKNGSHGWAKAHQLLELKDNPSEESTVIVSYQGAYIFDKADTIQGPLFELPFETTLTLLEELPQQNKRWLVVRLQDGKKGYVQRGQVQFSKSTLTLPEMVEFSHKFLNKKYLWGGTTSLGYDCSGFVQMLYDQMGIKIPRNSRHQAMDSNFEDIKLSEAKPGDLLFFIKKETGKVAHVGMMINNKHFIHAFPRDAACITISHIDEPRFVNGEYTTAIFLRRHKSLKPD